MYLSVYVSAAVHICAMIDFTIVYIISAFKSAYIECVVFVGCDSVMEKLAHFWWVTCRCWTVTLYEGEVYL